MHNVQHRSRLFGDIIALGTKLFIVDASNTCCHSLFVFAWFIVLSVKQCMLLRPLLLQVKEGLNGFCVEIEPV